MEKGSYISVGIDGLGVGREDAGIEEIELKE